MVFLDFPPLNLLAAGLGLRIAVVELPAALPDLVSVMRCRALKTCQCLPFFFATAFSWFESGDISTSLSSESIKPERVAALAILGMLGANTGPINEVNGGLERQWLRLAQK